MKRILGMSLLLSGAILTGCGQPAPSGGGTMSAQSASNGTYIVGAGFADSTGEMAENNFFGYADLNQVGSGLHDRMHARAFTITDPGNGKSVLIVVVDSGMISQAIHREVLKKLAGKYGGRFNESNVLISATHTHSAPGGFSEYALYGLTTLGFQKATFDAVVGGIVRAADRAVQSEAPASISFGRSQLLGASAQRSATAFVKNPPAEQALFPNQIDPDMAVLRFNRAGSSFAAMSFFAVHPTSLTSHNTLASSDNKGYASYYWEKLSQGTQYRSGKGFVAAFPNTNPGDVTANLNLRPGSGPTENEWDNARIIGEKQAVAAMSTPMTVQVTGSLDSRQKYVDMSRVVVRAEFTPDAQPHTTCPAAYKSAFAAGSTEDGGGGDGLGVKEGQSNPLLAALGYAIFWPSANLIHCQGDKEVTIPMGETKPYPMSPEVLPLEVVKLGQLALVALPGEFTIASGYRIKRTLAQTLQIPLENVLLMGYTNAYAGYNTTPEEYDQQDYEGASTHFGPYSVPAWQQNVAELAQAIRTGAPVSNTIWPRDLSSQQISLRTGVVYDSVPFGKNFGDVQTQPAASYTRGQTASAVFWSAHPKNNLRNEGTFLEIQRLENGTWQTVRDDADWDTTYRWKRNWTDESLVTIEWQIGQNVPAGTYRIVHYGDWKNGWTGQIRPFSGVSRSFGVQ